MLTSQACSLLLLSFYFLLPAHKARPLIVAFLHSISMLFHELAVFFYPVAVLGILLQTASLSLMRRVSFLLQYSLITFLLTFTAYYCGYYLQTGGVGFGRFVGWVTSYSPEIGFTFNAWNNFTYTLRGHLRLFFGGRFNSIKGLINPLVIVLMITGAAAASILLFKLVRSNRDIKTLWKRVREYKPFFSPLRLLCTAWIAVYLMFLFFFIPQNTFYRLFYLPAIIIFCSTFLASYEAQTAPVRKYRAAVFVLVVAIVNFLFLIFPYSHVQKNPPLALALEMNEDLPQGTVIYYARFDTDNTLFKYFNSSTTWRQLSTTNLEVLEGDLQSIYRGGGTAWLETSALDKVTSLADGAAWLESHAGEQPNYELVNDAYRIRYMQIVPRIDMANINP